VSFQGTVTAVDPTADILTVGTLRIGIVAATRFDPAGSLRSMGDIRNALTRGETVTVDGSGVATPSGLIEAREIRAQSSPPTGSIQFSGRVSAVDRATRRIVVQSVFQLVAMVPPSARFDPGGDLTSFEALADAFDRGDLLRVSGSGQLLADGSAQVDTLRVDIEGSGGVPATFAGQVQTVSTTMQRLTLGNGTVVVIGSGTRFDPAGDLQSLSAIASAVLAGTPVMASGDGTQRADGSILAANLRAVTQTTGPAIRAFAGVVTGVDRPPRLLLLQNGGRVEVPTSLPFDPSGDLFSFEAVADAFDDGQTVTVEGEGERQSDGRIRAARIKAEVVS
jgi:hypothetical protein